MSPLRFKYFKYNLATYKVYKLEKLVYRIKRISQLLFGLSPKTSLKCPKNNLCCGNYNSLIMKWLLYVCRNGPGGYPITTTGLRGPYPPLSSSPLSRFSPPGLLPPHPGLPPGFPHPGLMAPGPKQDLPPMTSDSSRWVSNDSLTGLQAYLPVNVLLKMTAHHSSLSSMYDFHITFTIL